MASQPMQRAHSGDAGGLRRDIAAAAHTQKSSGSPGPPCFRARSIGLLPRPRRGTPSWPILIAGAPGNSPSDQTGAVKCECYGRPKRKGSRARVARAQLPVPPRTCQPRQCHSRARRPEVLSGVSRADARLVPRASAVAGAPRPRRPPAPHPPPPTPRSNKVPYAPCYTTPDRRENSASAAHRVEGRMGPASVCGARLHG